MTMMATVLEEDAGQMPPDAAQAARAVSAETARLARLVDDLMEMARFDSGAARLVLAETDVADTIRATLRLRGWTDDAVETTVGYYSDVRDLTPEERRLFPAVAALDVVATTGRLLEQTFLTGSEERPPLPLRAAVEMMIRSMNAVERSLLGPIERKKKVWDYNRPPQRPRGGSSRDRRR
jgi:hypothetical protein